MGIVDQKTKIQFDLYYFSKFVHNFFVYDRLWWVFLLERGKKPTKKTINQFWFHRHWKLLKSVVFYIFIIRQLYLTIQAKLVHFLRIPEIRAGRTHPSGVVANNWPGLRANPAPWLVCMVRTPWLIIKAVLVEIVEDLLRQGLGTVKLCYLMPMPHFCRLKTLDFYFFVLLLSEVELQCRRFSINHLDLRPSFVE